MPSNIAKGVAPISAAAVQAVRQNYAAAFGVAMLYAHRHNPPMRVASE